MVPALATSRSPSGPRGSYGRGGGARHECGERHLYEVERHERQDALRQGSSEGKSCNHGEPGGPESVDEGKTCASPEQARPQSPPAGRVPRSVGGESRYGCGDRVGEQVPSRGTEQHAEPTPELGEDRHADGSDEQVDRLRERPVTRSEQEPGEDDRQNLQGEGYRGEGQRYGYLARHRRHSSH